MIDHRFESTLPTDVRDAIARDLQATLVHLIDLALQAKQMHWTVVGPTFRSLHLHLDEITASCREYADDVAERCAALGVPPDGTAARIVRQSDVPTGTHWFVQDSDCAQFMVDRLHFVVAAMRDVLDRIEDKDIVSHDLLIGIARGLEKHAWMLQASTITRAIPEKATALEADDVKRAHEARRS